MTERLIQITHLRELLIALKVAGTIYYLFLPSILPIHLLMQFIYWWFLLILIYLNEDDLNLKINTTFGKLIPCSDDET